MPRPLLLTGLCALSFACGASEASEAPLTDTGAELGGLVQRISGVTAARFADTLEEGETAARGPFAVRAGEKLVVTLAGRGDADLYVRFSSRPTLNSYDCRPYTEHSNEQCTLTVPSDATTAYVDVRAETASEYSLVLESVPAGSNGNDGGDGGDDSDGEARSESFEIAVLGSSTAEGEGASSLESSWVGLLGAQLSELGNVGVTNYATGGNSTLEILPRPENDDEVDGSIRDAISAGPDLIVISLAGGNDISRGTTPGMYMTRLRKASFAAEKAGIPTFFVGTAPKNASDEERLQLGAWNEEMRSRFSSCWTPSNEDYSPCFIDVMANLGNDDREIDPAYDSGDGIHINDAGHEVVFNEASEVITQYVCTQTECR